MFVDYSIPLNGILAAGRDFNQAAGRIASANLPSSDDFKDSVYISDFAEDFVSIQRSKTIYEANLKVISTQQELEQEVLDLFA